MESNKIKLCVFIHFSTGDGLPYYVEIFIKELSLHFDKIKVLSNNSNIKVEEFSSQRDVEFIYFENIGYDFGMFYRWFISEQPNNISELAIVNDSNILLKSLRPVFNWGRKQKADFWGVVDSDEKPWFSSLENCYHIQSHFMVLNEKAIGFLDEYLNIIDVPEILKMSDIKKLRRMVIDKWEIGLSQFFISQGLKPASFISHKNFRKNLGSKEKNITHAHYKELLQNGYPLLKKKITRSKKKWFKRPDYSWKEAVLSHNNSEWDLNKIISELD